MLKRIISTVLTIFLFILFSFSFIYSQSIQLLGNIKYGDLDKELGKPGTLETGYFHDLITDDIEIDYEKNIYLCDKYTKKILKFTNDMKLIYAKKISYEQLKSTHNFTNENQNFKKVFYNVDLETDKTGNLYVLVTMGEAYLNLIKFDGNGNLISEFHLSGQLPAQRLIDFFISNTGKIFINTFPHNPQDMHHINEGLVFVYNLDGEFLGRTDYFIEDNEGHIYKRNLLNHTQFQIDSFKKNNSYQIKKTTDIESRGNLKIDYSNNQTSWRFLGVDNYDNVYFIHGKEVVIIRKLNFKNNRINDIKIEKSKLDEMGVLFANNFNNISIAPDGDIIFCGIKRTERNKTLNDSFNIDDTSVSILKLTLSGGE